MTAAEVASRLGLKESTVVNQFNRTQERLRKRGIVLMKWGIGKDAEYDIEYDDLLYKLEGKL